jgi:hypothetical protein
MGGVEQKREREGESRRVMFDFVVNNALAWKFIGKHFSARLAHSTKN